MKKLTRHLPLIVALVSINCVFAQGTGPILNEEDVSRFIETYRPMTQELEALGHDLDMGEDENTENMFATMNASIAALMANNEVSAIINKYGWDEKFGMVFMTISFGYMYNTMAREMEALPDEQKEQVKPMMDMMLGQIRSVTHEKDLELVKSYLTELDPVFKE